jgi:hypothetical protein
VGFPRRFLVLTAFVAIILFVAFLSSYRPGAQPPARKIPSSNGATHTELLTGPGAAIAPKLGNETAKYACPTEPTEKLWTRLTSG